MITDCICYNLTFKEIQEDCMKDNIYSLPELKDTYSICNKCEMCNPYLENMFKTGNTEFLLTISNSNIHF